jgi:hypothetical protein
MLSKRIVWCGCVWLMFCVSAGYSLQAQPHANGTIIGITLNGETHERLDNVNVYLELTLLGCTSGHDGSFQVANIPPGLYTLVASRLGYEKKTIAVQIAEAETVRVDVACTLQPILLKETAVFGKRSSSTFANFDLQSVFFPLSTQQTRCIYGTAWTTPIGITFDDSSLCLYSLDIAVINSEPHLRLWLLYKNTADLPFVFDLLHSLAFRSLRCDTFEILTPVNSVTLLATTDTASATDTIAEKIGKTLQRLAAQERIVLNEREKFFGERIGGDGIMASGSLYQVFKSSDDDGILESQTIPPGKSINGYIYYRIPETALSATNADNSTYHLEITTPAGITAIRFVSN